MPTAAASGSIFGGFSNPAFITTDPDPKKTDQYIKAEVIPSRYTGANFKIGRPKKGHGRDAYFSKEILTFASKDQNPKGVADEFLDPGVHDRRLAKEQKKKNIDTRDFKYANPPKLSTGPGSYFGTFDAKPIPHKEEYKVQKRGEPSTKREVKVPKNILTSPGKKGTYGYIGTTFSKIEGPPKDKNDEYDALRKRELEEWKKSKEKMIAQQTFKSTIKGVRTFDEKKGTGVSAAFDSYEAPEEKKKSKKAQKPAEDKSKVEGRPVFRYSSAPKSGQHGCLNPFPNTRGDAPDIYESARVKALEDKKKAPAPLGGTWQPTTGPKTSVVRSLLKTYY